MEPETGENASEACEHADVQYVGCLAVWLCNEINRYTLTGVKSVSQDIDVSGPSVRRVCDVRCETPSFSVGYW